MMSADVQTNQPQHFFEHCATERIRLSIKCKIVVQVFCRVNQNMDAESLWLLIKNDGHAISRATVYRILDWLSKKGFVKRQKTEKAGSTIFSLYLP